MMVGSLKRFCVKNNRGNVVFIDNDFVDYGRFVDVDGDGFKDILLERSGVDSGHQDLVLYNPKTKKFILAGNCSNPNKIKHTKYLYTYDDCCMGRFFSSDLLFIDNFKIITVGHIKYDDGDGLKFYKFNGKKRIFMQKWKVRINGRTPVMMGHHIDFDLGDYWTKHYSKFVK